MDYRAWCDACGIFDTNESRRWYDLARDDVQAALAAASAESPCPHCATWEQQARDSQENELRLGEIIKAKDAKLASEREACATVAGMALYDSHPHYYVCQMIAAAIRARTQP